MTIFPRWTRSLQYLYAIKFFLSISFPKYEDLCFTKRVDLSLDEVGFFERRELFARLAQRRVLGR